MESDFTISIVGMGLIGGSIGLALKKAGFNNIYGIDIDRNIIDKALNCNAIDKGFLNIEEPLSKSDLVFICIYPKATKDFIISNLEHFKKGSIVTDVAGIKTPMIEGILPVIDNDIDFIPGHPMAGREEGGIEFATEKIFEKANYILIPTEKNKRENIDKLRAIIEKMKFKSIVETDSFTHDENISYVSQLPHIAAVSMVNCKNIDNVDLFAGGSYRDTTRVARINAKLWSELFIENKNFIVNQIDLFVDYILKIRDTIDKEDVDNLVNMLKESYNRKGDSVDEKTHNKTTK